MAVDLMNDDLIAEMEQGVETAKQRASTGNTFFFKIGDGQRAMIRFLLNLGEGARVWKHESFNPSTNKYDVSALCSVSADLPAELCKHCQDAKANKELKAKKYFVVPVYVYGIRDVKTNEVVTWKDKQTEEIRPVTGVQLLCLRDGSMLLSTLLEHYRMLEQGDSFTNHDMTISMSRLNGDPKKPNYTPILKPAQTSFVPPEGVEVPKQDREEILQRLLELWVPGLIGQTTPPAQSSGTPARSAVPDF